ncbi:MAG: class I SAM-dependent methyltransferase [Planctomycetota bacterium]|jgi:SAM-dependent methyltransferase
MPKTKKTIHQLAYETLRRSLGDMAGQRILEVGAGSGDLSQKLAEDGAVPTALDLIEPANLTHPSASFVRHDLTEGKLPFEAAHFDCVVSTEVIEHMKAPFVLLHSMVHVLRPGGMLLLTMPNYWNLKYRLRYLLTGNIPMPTLSDPAWQDRYLAGYAPHINVLTYPTLRSVLTWEGCSDFQVETPRRFNWRRVIGYLPLFLLVSMNRWITKRRLAEEMLLAETGSASVLYGSRHLMLQCRRSA